MTRRWSPAGSLWLPYGQQGATLKSVERTSRAIRAQIAPALPLADFGPVPKHPQPQRKKIMQRRTK